MNMNSTACALGRPMFAAVKHLGISQAAMAGRRCSSRGGVVAERAILREQLTRNSFFVPSVSQSANAFCSPAKRTVGTIPSMDHARGKTARLYRIAHFWKCFLRRELPVGQRAARSIQESWPAARRRLSVARHCQFKANAARNHFTNSPRPDYGQSCHSTLNE